jgi:hypothetical protein
MATVNTGGVANLNNIAYTELNGLNLTVDQKSTVTTNVDTAVLIENLIQAAANSAIYENIDHFSLDKAFGANTAPTLAQAKQFLKDHLKLNLTDTQSLSIDQWRGVKAAVENFGFKEASKLSATDGGGIKSVNGNWYINGQLVTLEDVFLAVRVNQLSNFNDQISTYMTELQNNNNLVKQANWFLERLNAEKPTNTNDTITWTDSFSHLVASFSNLYGYNPLSVFLPNSLENGTLPNANQTKFDVYIQELKTYTSAKDSENQVAQTYLEQLNNKRSEVLDSLTNFTKSQGQIDQSVARNIG